MTAIAPARTRALMTAVPWLFLAVVVPLRLSDLWNVKAAGIELTVLEFLAFGYHLRAATRPGLTRAERRPWILTSVTLVMLLLTGIAMAAVFGNGSTNWTPSMVLAILIRTLLCPVLLGALLSFPARPLGKRARLMLLMDVVTVLGASLMVMWYAVLGPAWGHGELLRPLRFGAALFSIADVVVLIGIGTVITRGADHGSRRPLAIMLASAFSYLVVDVYFLRVSLIAEKPTPIMPTLVIIPVFLMLLAALAQPAPGEARAGDAADWLPRRHNWLPYGALACGFGLLLFVAVRSGMFPWVGLIVGAVLMTAGVVARQVAASRENYRLVIIDSLTGLNNRVELRRLLGDATERHRRTGDPVAVLLIDLDGFKGVNDAYGHEVGDQMLIAFAGILRRAVRREGTAIRLGGDEFAVVMPAVGGTDDGVRMAERIIAGCEPPLTLSGHEVRLRASIGVAVAAGRDEIVPTGLLREADRAMYAAKRRGTHSWVVYSPETADIAQPIEAPIPLSQAGRP